ncbi:hypothetical protein GCM10022200_19070 [Microbacterium awajiense]|uniref:Uncharacterized protein n=1 Tax=Microbacterium awajiense TaxID=415214 RepID=A0ABP7AN52_9MICO
MTQLTEDPQRTVPYGAVFAPAPPRRRAWPWILVVGLVALLAVGAAAVHVWANLSFDQAHASAAQAAVVYEGTAESARVAADGGATEVSAASSIIASAVDDLVDASARAELAEAAGQLDDAVDEAEQLLDVTAPAVDVAKPAWPWELFAAASDLDEAAPALRAQADGLGAVAGAVDAESDALTAAAVQLYASVPAAADALEAEHISARATVMLDFVEAAQRAAGQERAGSGAELAFTAYANAAEALQTSSAAELAEKAGPLLETRLTIEEYARSIAGGVTLDFDWAPVVNGVGGFLGMAGTATWNTGRGGFSTITLSDSVATNWPSLDAQALVTHEVGHAITSKCSDLFDSDDPDQNELWATAWAISMGFDTPGNGTQAYGYPPQELIDIAATCR